MIRVHTVTCPFCKSEIYSRAVHDYRYCKCKKTSVDGGFAYLKLSHDPSGPVPKTQHRFIKATKTDLFKDWNLSLNQFGFIGGPDAKNMQQMQKRAIRQGAKRKRAKRRRAAS